MAEMDITKANFKKVTGSGKPVFIDFWAPWCMPCRMVMPTVSKLAEKYDGKAIVGRVNVDEEPELTRRFGIRGVPTFVVMKNGKVMKQKVGALTRRGLDKMIESAL